MMIFSLWQFVVACLLIQCLDVSGRRLGFQGKKNFLNNRGFKQPHLNMAMKAVKRDKTGSFTINGDVTGGGQYNINQDKVDVDVKLSIKNAGSQDAVGDGTAKPTSLSTPTFAPPTKNKDATTSSTQTSTGTATMISKDVTTSPATSPLPTSKGSRSKDGTSPTSNTPTISTGATSKGSSSKDATSSPTSTTPTLSTGATSKGSSSKDATSSPTPNTLSRSTVATRKGSSSKDATSSPTSTTPTMSTVATSKGTITHKDVTTSATSTTKPRPTANKEHNDTPSPTHSSTAPPEDQHKYTAPTKALLHRLGSSRQTELTKLKSALAHTAANWALNLRNGIQPRKYENPQTKLQSLYNHYHNYIPRYGVNMRQRWY